MTTLNRPTRWTWLLALLLSACGGGGGSSAPATVPATAVTALQQQAGAPAFLNDTAQDGMNWINFRRLQAGVPVLLANAQVAQAAQGHSNYQKVNNVVTHDQDAGKPAFTGVALLNRLVSAGYLLGDNGYAVGEVISATSSNNGFYMAEELITAIYHRFVIFEPRFKEIGTGALSASSGYTYFTSDFAARNGYGPGIGSGNMVTWPTDGQQGVPTNFFSDFESPDPVPNANEVGYPISVHADLRNLVTVQSFTVAPRGGSDLAVRLLSKASDAETSESAAAIVPLAVLKSGTTYDVRFSGHLAGVPVSKSWSFTTK
jgi:uncharacterized protein YkwD